MEKGYFASKREFPVRIERDIELKPKSELPKDVLFKIWNRRRNKVRSAIGFSIASILVVVILFFMMFPEALSGKSLTAASVPILMIISFSYFMLKSQRSMKPPKDYQWFEGNVDDFGFYLPHTFKEGSSDYRTGHYYVYVNGHKFLMRAADACEFVIMRKEGLLLRNGMLLGQKRIVLVIGNIEDETKSPRAILI